MAKKVRKGKRLTKTGSYKIDATKGRKRSFRGTLLKAINIGSKRIAIFSVPKNF